MPGTQGRANLTRPRKPRAAVGRALRWLPLSLLTVAALGTPAQAGLLGSVLMLLRPQLETRLSDLCVRTAAGGQAKLEQSLRKPCQQLAVPASRCLIEETEASGRGLAVLQELLGNRIGTDSELVIKRCTAKLLGLPANALQGVPLKDLQRRLNPSRTEPDQPQSPSPASPESALQ